jgi:predicted kinase
MGEWAEFFSTSFELHFFFGRKKIIPKKKKKNNNKTNKQMVEQISTTSTTEITPRIVDIVPSMASTNVEEVKKQQQRTLYLIRGISGSGKTTLARHLLETECNKGGQAGQAGQADGQVFSTDDFFIDKSTGEYKWNGQDLKAAHEWCQRQVWNAMQLGVPNIIVANTFIQRWEAKWYCLAAQRKEHSYVVEIREPTTEWKDNVEELAKRNVHNVSLQTIIKMKAKWHTIFDLHSILESVS